MLFSLNLLSAQSNVVELILSSDSLDLVEYEAAPLKISCTTNVTISGEFDSDIFVLIKPSINNSIKIVPESLAPSTNSGVLIDPPSTTIKSGPKGNGGIPNPNRIVIYPNPVQSELNFTITDKLVNFYTIINQFGLQKSGQSILPTNIATINVSNLTSGIYFLKLNLDNGQQLSIQFIKN